MKPFSKYQMAFMVLPLLGVGSLHFTQAPLVWALWALGKTGGCPLSMVPGIPALVDRQNMVIDDLKATSTRENPDETGLVRWTTKHGVFWAPPGNPVDGILSEQIVRFYGDGPRRVQKGDVVLDCGANIGTFVWEALQAGASKVIAIEPSAINVAALHRTFAAEIAAGRVVVYPKGLWDSETELTFYTYDDSALDSAVLAKRTETDQAPKAVKVPVTTIDKLVAELGLEKIDFIKMDIEGAEMRALEGARKTIGKHLPAMSLATENKAEDEVELPKWVTREFPAYKSECGRCSSADGKVIKAEVFYFHTI